MDEVKSKKRKQVYVEFIQNTHKKLRKDIHDGKEFAKVWQTHVEDKVTLKQYSASMTNLSNEVWENSDTGKDRTLWCKKMCEDYFFEGGMKRHLDKDRRRNEFYELNKQKGFHCGPNPSTLCCNVDIESKNVILNKIIKVKLLDVGSCFNPFKDFDIFDTIAIDLLPANEYVFQCDFLSVPIIKLDNCTAPCINVTDTIKDSEKSENKITSLSENHFDVVVFSLLLTYIPCPEKRLNLCQRAYKVLKVNGLLLIVSPDSCHQNKHAKIMKQWKFSIENLGFERIKYQKDEHLHLLAFRKVSINYLWDNKLIDIYRQSEHGLFIPQDSNKSN